MDLDTSVPPWLQRNLAFREPFDPTPWLQERYRRQVQAQTLPLQIQGMALENQAHALAIQHQGMINEAAGIELMNDAKDVPVLQQALAKAAQTPGGSLSMSPPAFSGKRARDAWLNQQKMDADTVYGQSLKERIIDQTRRASEIMAKGGPMLRPGPDGTYNEQDLSAAGDALRQKEQQQELSMISARTAAEEAAKESAAKANLPLELQRIQARAEAEAKFKQMYEKDPALQAGLDLAKMKEALLQSQKATATVAESTPELEDELSRQRQLQTAIDTMEQKTRKSPGTLAEKMNTVKDLNAEVDSAANSGDPAALQDAIQRRDAMEALLYPKGTKIAGTDPITGKPVTRVVGGTTVQEDELTAKTRSSLQQQVQGSIQSAKILHDLEQKVDWTTVGPLAFFAEKLGRFGPGSLIGLGGESGAAGRAEIRGAKLDVMQQMERAGHSSTAVMKTIESTLPHLGLFERPEAARAAVEDRRRSVILEGLNASHQLGQVPPAELIQLLSTYKATELRRMVNSGLLQPDDAISAYKLQQKSPANNPSNTPVADWLKR